MKPSETVRSAKSGKEVAKVGGGKLSSAYWLPRIYRPKYSNPDGTSSTVAFWWARVAHARQRHAVNLGTADKRAAAARAAGFFADVIRSGWDSALATLNPDRHASREGLTVGDLVGMLDRLDLRPRTRANYANALRWWAARHLEAKPGPKEFGRDVEEWRKRVHAVPLSALGSARLEQIRDAHIATAGKRELEERRARVSVRSFLRNAKAAVSACARLGRMQFKDPRPFDGVTVSGAVVTPYRSKIDPRALLRDARESLRVEDPEAYRVVLLALGAGLRRSEIENLRWHSIDRAAGRIWVEASGTWRPKTTDSEGGVDVDPGLLSELAAGLPGGPGELVVLPGAAEVAVQWLRSRGVDSNKPLHTLRKEFGSIVAHSADLLTASRQLRHSSLAVTAGVYVEARKRAAPAIGAMLEGGEGA